MVRHTILPGLLSILFWSECISPVESFSVQRVSTPISGISTYQASALNSALCGSRSDEDIGHPKGFSIGGMLSSALLVAVISASSPAFADEIGVEKEAPTLFTGETVEICTKRGPLGACLATEIRTLENDNDKSEKYFRGGSELANRREEMKRNDEGNLLIEKLRKQSEDNREKNELIVKQKTALNDQSANFGPFNGSVVILNEDGKGFTLLENPQAMRLKNAGLIKDRQFVRQPTQQELDDALEPETPGFLKGLFGGGGE